MDVLDYLRSIDITDKYLTFRISDNKEYQYSSLDNNDLSFEYDGYVLIKRKYDEVLIKLESIVSVEIDDKNKPYWGN